MGRRSFLRSYHGSAPKNSIGNRLEYHFLRFGGNTLYRPGVWIF